MTQTILVVDDEPDILEVVGSFLCDQGYRVLQADGIEAALAMLRTAMPPVALVVSDVRMPQNGHALVPECQRLYPDMPVILMTGYDLNLAQFVLWPILRKPFRLRALLAAVTTALGESVTAD